MVFQLTQLTQLSEHGFDQIIDVRSPAEFAEDHVPGAINLPALSDAERARVGTIYKHDSPFAARKIGAAMVARNVAAHLDGPLAAHDGGWHPLIYCWRGGQRSGSVASMLQAVGWRAEVLEGGYRSFRRLVVAMLHDRAVAHRLVLLDGNTGTAKTDVLARLSALGVQTLDLEGAANHRGSMLGARPGGQPSQKAFEARLAMVLAAHDPARPVVVEAESSKVGACLIPPSLWQAMCAAPRIELTAEPSARAAYLARTYNDSAGDPDSVVSQLEAFRHLQGATTVAAWQDLARAGALVDLARALAETHYDPAYAKSRARHAATILDRVEMGDLSVDAQERAARAIKARLSE